MTAEDVLKDAAAVVDAVCAPAIMCDVQPAPGLPCGSAARYSATCMGCGGQTFLCTGHLLAGGLGQLSSGTYYLAVMG